MAEWGRAWHRYRRENRFLIAAFAVLLLLSLGAFYLLQRTQSANPEELANRLLLFVLWYLDISLILILSFILVRSLVRLAVERRSGILGSRFRTKLVLTYAALTFLPVLFIFLIATNLLQRSIDRWFSSPVEDIMRGGAEITVELRELIEERLEHQARIAAEQLARDPRSERVAELQRLLGVDLVALYDDDRLLQAAADPRRIPSALPSLRRDAPSGVRADRWQLSLVVRAWEPVGARGRTVVVGTVVPRELLVHLERATAADAAFQEMKAQRGVITATTVLVFLAVTLLLLFATVWVGLYLSRRFTQPLLAVAAATQRVAEGSDLEEVAVPASDEVAVLVHSFNEMVRRVRATEAEILASNQELATILGTIPTGVLSVDPDGRRFRPNPAASRMLGEDAWMGRWMDLELLARPGLASLGERLRAERGRDVRFEVELDGGHGQRHVEVTIKPASGGGSVVAMDDLTQLVRAQRLAAWGEVAQRVAHEIKNPLTPIRLAAERIQRRTADLDDELRAVVGTSCEAIVNQVTGLTALVDAFRDYARLPVVAPRQVDVARLVREVGSLYGGVREEVTVRVQAPDIEVPGEVDPDLLRQALVNLVDNALDAIDGPGEVVIRLSRSDADLVFEVEDTGRGLPETDPETLLLPFYSTKGRGSGMGLALVHRVVTDHGGLLEISDRSPGGARVRITVPDASRVVRPEGRRPSETRGHAPGPAAEGELR